jgi:hypothetical protein
VLGVRFLFLAVLALSTGCFSAARPIKRMSQGEMMIGTNLNVPGTIGDPEVSAWFRVAPFDGADITAGASSTIPITAKNHYPGYGGFLELRGHFALTEGWRLVLDAEGEFYRLNLRTDDWSNHWRASFVPYFVAELSRVSIFFGPKGSWLTGFREISASRGANPVAPVPGAPGLVFAGVSLGAEDPQPVWFFTSIGGAFDLGTVITLDTQEVAVPLAYSMSIYFGFL